MTLERLRTVVVGAGAAGLTAAYALHTAGAHVLCLEARNRIGGRLLSTSEDTGSLDLGATWFWDEEPRVAALTAHTNIATFAQHTEGSALLHDTSGVHRFPGNPIDVHAYRYVTGADTVAARLAAVLPPDGLRLDAPVTAIREARDHLRVHTRDMTFRADHVVLAVPPALAIAGIDFDDALPTGLAAVAARTPVWMGAVRKVVARYTEPFWRYDDLAGSAVSRIGPLQEIHDMSGPNGNPPALFGFAASTTVHAGFREAVVDQLADLFGPAARHPQQLLVMDWSREAWTSPSDVHRLSDYSLFGHPAYQRPTLGGRLHWASTETATDHAGHVEGALQAGQRAAHDILQTDSHHLIHSASSRHPGQPEGPPSLTKESCDRRT